MPQSFLPNLILLMPHVRECVERGFVAIEKGRITYSLNQKRIFNWNDPEEWIRCQTVCFLIIGKHYPANRIKIEVNVPRRTPNDFADIVVYRDDKCREPYLIVENKAEGQSAQGRAQGIEQLFGNSNSLRAPLGLYDEGKESILFDVAGHPSTERIDNRLGDRLAVPEQYGEVPEFSFFAGKQQDIRPTHRGVLENKIKRAHSIIWAGGKRDPLTAFDEWSKLLFAKVNDERRTPTGEARAFQVGSRETSASVANRIHKRFSDACAQDPSVFKAGARLALSDRKIMEVVKVLQDVSFMMTDVDTIGAAFESFFGSVFRGELGQYFTMRQLARFTVAAADVTEADYCLDPTAGSGGFLLELLLQVWHHIDTAYAGQIDVDRTKIDFALHKVFGIEIHEVLARICKINLVLHHDGHTNIEGDKSCLDTVFSRPRLNPPEGKFTKIFGNPPFGDDVRAGDEDLLGENSLDRFSIAAGREQVASEHVIVERCIELLEATENSRFGLILPDGLFNNQGEQSNCPQVRRMLASRGQIEAIVSLPDHAFRKSGAQNKTSILFFRKFTPVEHARAESIISNHVEAGNTLDDAIALMLGQMPYKIFLAEANHVGYTTTGAPSELNDLYHGAEGGFLDQDQEGSILGEYRRFKAAPDDYIGRRSPDCMALDALAVWLAHPSHRLDPKYHLFKQEELEAIPEGWTQTRIGNVMRKREEVSHPEESPDERVQVMTISQTGEIRPRAAGKGRNPPEWLGMYFEDSPSTWFKAKAGDVVYSSIDLWKGCVSVVPSAMDGALVTKEFPIYQVVDENLDPEFLSVLLRSRYYQRAFRAITTGHSNRRRTQSDDFENLEIAYPPKQSDQIALISEIVAARNAQRGASSRLAEELLKFNDLIDGRGNEQLPEIVDLADDEASDD